MTRATVMVDTNGAAPGASTISESWFGAIQTGYRTFSGFDTAAQDIDIGLLRWPGGTLSETRPEVYGLDIPGLFDATDLWAHNPDRQRPDITDALAYSVQEGLAFSLIVPTARYADDLATGQAHLTAFLEELFTGTYGDLPEHLTLELGNEFYDLDVFGEDPSAYGEVASQFAVIIQAMADAHLSEEQHGSLDIAVQMGRSTGENDLILNAFSDAGLTAISSVVFHSLPISLNNLNRVHDDRDGLTRYDAASQLHQTWAAAIAAAGGGADPDLFLSAWAVGGSGGTGDNMWHEYGSKSSAMVLDTFAGYASIGVDAAAVWGMNSDHINRVSTAEGAASELTHVGELLKLMSVSLPGLALQGAFEPHSRGDDLMVWSFGMDATHTSYFAINELNEANGGYTVGFDGVANFQMVSATLLTSEFEDGFAGLPTDPDASQYERPVLGSLDYVFSDSGVSFDFVRNYDVVELSIRENEGTTGSVGSDWMSGAGSDDDMTGYAGDDFITGHAGNDTIDGGDGSDQIEGGAGHDFIFGDGTPDSEAWALYQLYTAQANSEVPAIPVNPAPAQQDSAFPVGAELEMDFFDFLA